MGQMAASKIGNIVRRVQGVTAYWSRDSQDWEL